MILINLQKEALEWTRQNGIVLNWNKPLGVSKLSEVQTSLLNLPITLTQVHLREILMARHSINNLFHIRHWFCIEFRHFIQLPEVDAESHRSVLPCNKDYKDMGRLTAQLLLNLTCLESQSP